MPPKRKAAAARKAPPALRQKTAAAGAAPPAQETTIIKGGKPLTADDRKTWKQAIALLAGLKARNDFEEEDLTAAVGIALRPGSRQE